MRCSTDRRSAGFVRRPVRAGVAPPQKGRTMQKVLCFLWRGVELCIHGPFSDDESLENCFKEQIRAGFTGEDSVFVMFPSVDAAGVFSLEGEEYSGGEI